MRYRQFAYMIQWMRKQFMGLKDLCWINLVTNKNEKKKKSNRWHRQNTRQRCFSSRPVYLHHKGWCKLFYLKKVWQSRGKERGQTILRYTIIFRQWKVAKPKSHLITSYKLQLLFSFLTSSSFREKNYCSSCTTSRVQNGIYSFRSRS